ncbi:MAG: hypothetical protein ACSHX7_12950 [Luteolibacter sp.]
MTKQRKILLGILLLVIAAAIFFIEKKNNGTGISEPASRASLPKRRIEKPVKGALDRQIKTEREIADVESRALEEIRAAANGNDGGRFRTLLLELLSRNFIGDPETVLKQLKPYLDHKNGKIRYELAKVYLWAGLNDQKVTLTLANFLTDKNAISVEMVVPGTTSEKYEVDLRKDAAKLLATYRITDAADPMWMAYQQTSDRTYLRYLSVLNDDRAKEEAVELVHTKKAKYTDFLEIFGRYKAEETAEPLEAIFEARRERYPDKNQQELAWTLYRVTGNKDYHEYVLEREAFYSNLMIESPDVLRRLEESLNDSGATDSNGKETSAFISLLAREKGHAAIEKYLIKVFDGDITSSLDATLKYRSAAYLNNELVNEAAQRNEEKFGNGLWPHYVKRLGWPINDLISNYKY